MISEALREAALQRYGGFCHMCGSTAGDLNPCDGTFVRLSVEAMEASEIGRSDPVTDLRVLCTCCSEGIRGMELPKPNRIHLLSQMRRATTDDQKAVLKWLLTKFGISLTPPPVATRRKPSRGRPAPKRGRQP